MAKGKAGRRPWKAPDGVATQPPTQTAKANAVPRKPMMKRNIYADMHMSMQNQYRKVKPGYGKTGRFA